jgi:predicted nucleotidyltransferase component of viral defense system
MPHNTKEVFKILSGKKFMSKFTLVGGTSLAIQIKHRLSEYLDFISDEETLNINQIKRNISKTFPSYKIVRQDNGWQIDFIVNDCRVTFFSSGSVVIPFEVKKYSFKHGSMNICNKEIIGVLKMATIAQRNTIRDYYDLYYLARHYQPLENIISQTKELIPELSPITYTETLVYTDDIEEDDLSNHLQPAENITKSEIANFFVHELRRIKDVI